MLTPRTRSARGLTAESPPTPFAELTVFTATTASVEVAATAADVVATAVHGNSGGSAAIGAIVAATLFVAAEWPAIIKAAETAWTAAIGKKGWLPNNNWKQAEARTELRAACIGMLRRLGHKVGEFSCTAVSAQCV